ncbi:hypothetical protein V5O48_018216, partial [Marasmius crinis-equi]
MPLFFQPRATRGISRPAVVQSRDRHSGSSESTREGPELEANSDGSPAREDVFRRDNFDNLIKEIAMVMDNDEFADVRIEEGRVIDESISEEDEDSTEVNAKAAEKETAESEVPERSVLHQYLLNIRTNIQKEINDHGQPQCYIDGQFFIHPRHPVFALHNAARTTFSPDPLCFRPVFVWLPTYLPHRPEHYKCHCGGRLTMNGYNDNIARRVRTSTGEDYFLLTNRYICDARRAGNPGCGTSYQGSDPHIIGQLPRWIQEAFPAYLTARSAVDKLVIDQMKACFAGRFGPEPFSKMLRELQMLEQSRRELMYLTAAVTYGLSGSTQVPPFPAFNDRMKYAGSAPSIFYVKCVWTDFISAVKMYMDRVQASLTAFKLAGDHTFRIMKAMARLKSEPIFSALFSLVNEWEEIRAQAMGLTKGFSILPEMFKEVSVGLKEHGHQPTALYFCDNPLAERDFHEKVTQSLKDNVHHISARNDLPPERALFKITSPFDFYDTFMTVNSACDSILEDLASLRPTETLVVALSIHRDHSLPEVLRSIQVRTRDKIIVLDVKQLPSSNIPGSLHALLTNPRIIKVGYGIQMCMAAIAAAFEMPELVAQAASASLKAQFLELGRLAKVKGAVQDPSAPLCDLVLVVLKKHLPQEPSPRTSSEPSLKHWSDDAALNVDCIWHVYRSLAQYKSVGLPLSPSETRVGQLVTLVASCKEVAEGVVLEHDGTIRVVMDDDGTETDIKITPAYSLIQINKVLVSGQLVSKHKQTVQWIYEHGIVLVFKLGLILFILTND